MTDTQLQELQARAQKALQAGNTSLAFECFQECLHLAPTNTQARYGAALSAARLGSISVAEGLLEPMLASSNIEPELHVDCLSLRGRLQKDRYERELDPERQRAAALLSAKAYELAYQESGSYYPGANAATMFLLAGHEEKSADLVDSVLPQCLHLLKDNSTDDAWLAATLGELLFLILYFQRYA